MHVTFGQAMGGTAPVLSPRPRIAESVTTSGTSASSSAAAKNGEFARVKAIDAALYVACVATAAATNGYYLAAGEQIDLGPLVAGDVVSGIEA